MNKLHSRKLNSAGMSVRTKQIELNSEVSYDLVQFRVNVYSKNGTGQPNRIS